MKDLILIDIGSSTVKIYKFEDEKLELVQTKSILFKDGFDPETGISEQNKKELFEYLNGVKKEFKDYPIEIYATAIFRKFNPKAQKNFIEEFNDQTQLQFKIISQEQENHYLELALIGKCDLNENILLINIGGGSTELVIVKNKEIIEKQNIDFGVMNVMNEFPYLNEEFSRSELKNVVEVLKSKIPEFHNRIKVAIYSGGELNYMKLANYKLEPNILFDDSDHPNLISFENFKTRNDEIFSKVKFSQLESMMPENPKWMHGARACSAFAQAICEKYGIEKIIPSDSNLINGVVRELSFVPR